MKPFADILSSMRCRAVGATAVAVIAIVSVLLLGRLSFDASALPDPPRPVVEILAVEEEPVEEYVETFTPEPVAAARTPMPARRRSDASAAAPKEPTSKAEAPAGPTPQEIENERITREAQRGVADAFADDGDNNTDSRGSEAGDSGEAGQSPGAMNGRGSGNVTGGWIMPRYAPVPATCTGRIELTAVIDAQGKVTSCRMTGGKAPAASDRALVEACIAEVKRHTFTRNDDDAPQSARATIIYQFN